MSQSIADHYSYGRLLEMIRAGLAGLGKNPDAVTVDDLGPVDEFHIGGRKATAAFLDPLKLSADDHVLDVGCGFGGTARYMADRFGCQVTGIDLTPEFIETGQELCHWVGLDDRIELHQGSALAMPFDEATFDIATMLHVGMNIANKQTLFAEVAKVLKPGGRFAIYDIMRLADTPLEYPVPWATDEVSDALATQAIYEEALADAGFTITHRRNCLDSAMAFFEEAKRRVESGGETPALGIHIAMGDDASTKIRNMVNNVAARRVAPVELVATRAN